LGFVHDYPTSGSLFSLTTFACTQPKIVLAAAGEACYNLHPRPEKQALYFAK
jgi:hypothetical protein